MSILAGFAALSAGRKALILIPAIVGIFAMLWWIYAGAIRPVLKPTPTQTTNRKADTMIEVTYSPKVGIGCMRVLPPQDIIRPVMEKKQE